MTAMTATNTVATSTVAPATSRWTYHCEEMVGPLPRPRRRGRKDDGLITFVVREDDGLCLRVGGGGRLAVEDCPSPVGDQPEEVWEVIRFWRMSQGWVPTGYSGPERAEAQWGFAGWREATLLIDYLDGKASYDALREEVHGSRRASAIAAGIEALRDERREEWGAR